MPDTSHTSHTSNKKGLAASEFGVAVGGLALNKKGPLPSAVCLSPSCLCYVCTKQARNVLMSHALVSPL